MRKLHLCGKDGECRGKKLKMSFWAYEMRDRIVPATVVLDLPPIT